MEATESARRTAMPRKKSRSLLADLLVRLVREKPLGTVGAAIVFLAILAGALAGVLAPYDYKALHLADALTGPSANYILGTDNLGRDLLSRIIYGARISMVVGLSAAAIGALTSTLIGVVSGFLGGKVDMVVQRFVDAWMCFPPLIIVISLMAIMKPGLLPIILVLGISRGISGSRVLRSAVIGIKENVYVEAAGAVGCSTRETLTRHILPNIMAPIIILFSIGVGSAILAEATLSFLGYGLPPTIPSWGGMLSSDGRRYMYMAPWLAVWPGLALAIVVYGVNMLGDAVRDILDPRLRGGLGRYGRAKSGKTQMAKT